MIYLELFITFFEIGAFTFGGGYTMLTMVQSQVVAHNWLSQKEIVNFIAVSESTPGPFAVNISTYVGMETGGVFGAFCATFGVVLPSFLIILIVAKCFEKFRTSKLVKGFMTGLKPAVVGLIGAAVITTGNTVFNVSAFSVDTFFSFTFISSVVIFGIMIFLSIKKINPMIIILSSACLGIAVGYISKIVI